MRNKILASLTLFTGIAMAQNFDWDIYNQRRGHDAADIFDRELCQPEPQLNHDFLDDQ